MDSTTSTQSKVSDEGSSSPLRPEIEMKGDGETDGEEERETGAPPPPRPAAPPAPPPPVDGGLVCWLQVVGAFGIWLNVSFSLPVSEPMAVAWLG